MRAILELLRQRRQLFVILALAVALYALVVLLVVAQLPRDW
jgi:hypothetical protein